MRVLYYDCSVGISGDMNLGALIDLGVDKEYLKKELAKLRLDEEFTLDIHTGIKSGITGIKADVVLAGEAHAHEQGHEHGYHHQHAHSHIHDHHHHHTHSHDRTYGTIKEMILSSPLIDEVKDISLRIFHEIAIAEAKVHGKTVDEVHFHEVGAVDSIVDIVGAAICIDYLKVDRIMSSSVQVGAGFVWCTHGKIPVPAPATVEILKGIPMKTGLVQSESTTPTGAAILKAMVHEFTDIQSINIESIGYGLGTKDFEVPNVLRVFLGEMNESTTTQKQYIIETNIDDMNPEHYEFVEQKLFDAGALDVFKTPIIMKKGRPAVKLSVLFTDDKRFSVQHILFTDTSSAGIREYEVTKTMLDRTFRTIDTEYGPVTVKDLYWQDACVKSKPEYEDCKRLANQHGIPVHVIEEAVKRNNRYAEQI
ncbi:MULTISPECIES: nickel pincer cofactor biosynthesis protein LarC [unclassified Fusibacter]|uniref:nickel pincer cofactor biosynthesis protein LarC n=1 Tax=unclassified Fusibacter TaxID=2624464 RepID=UPI001010A33C|nr:MULTISPECIES: nickel pincer cofactor biosynthesis protein LarC [unclassified Fusibacter]MCK8060808.1 nickel pincer cofactor biosynthesis protein LarC [Fusibacter sp. A2]NPE23104.1 nickel pincer cofactor biosynthesis protein LarC [Fusibacter sp. A1]RXV59775.1 nickel pincer cofactor biosynthesis protein LarC [Fusibacter sp. A1]